jgi:hypothetical protein
VETDIQKTIDRMVEQLSKLTIEVGAAVVLILIGVGLWWQIDRMTDVKACKAGYAMSTEMGDYGRAMESCLKMLTEKNP